MILELLANVERTNEQTRRECWRIRSRLLAPMEQATEYVHVEYVDARATEFNGTIQEVASSGAYKRVDTLALHYQGRVNADVGLPTSVKVETPKDDTPAYAERGCNDKVTSPLFCSGQHEVDGFKRGAALQYITRRMVYHGGYAKGKAERAEGEKTTSALHEFRLFNLSVCEDICQAAFLIFWEMKVKGRFITTREACRFSVGKWLRDARKQKNAALVYLNTRSMEDKPRRTRLPVDRDTETLLDATVYNGEATVNGMAEYMGVHRNTVSNKLRKLRKGE